MRLLISIMIYAGSALMVYNIARYGSFVKTSRDLTRKLGGMGIIIVPLLLLVFFLIGYLVVGVSGIADLMMAAILLGGSIFVFLLLSVMYSIINHIRDTDQVLSHRYEEMKSELASRSKDSLAAFLVNLTRDEVEERGGQYLYDSDYDYDTYSELLEARAVNVLDSSYGGPEKSRFRREELLRLYHEGQTYVSQVMLVHRKDGEAGYVRFEATLSKMPVTGDIVAFLLEHPCNEEVVQQMLLGTVLMDQYDRIAYLVDGKYRVISSNAGKKGLLLPDDREDTYESLYLNYILPAMSRDGEKAAGPNPLRLSEIDKALAEKEVYDVNAPFILEGEKRYKHLVFYLIDRGSRFYLMLVSDSTSLQEEQTAQNKRLSDALAEAVRAKNARSSFFTRISHDLRTPVDSILDNAALAAAANDPADARGYARQISLSGSLLRSLIEDLFDMTEIDAGGLVLTEKPTDLRLMAEEVAAQFAGERPEKRLRFLADASGLTECVVYCDEKRLRRVLGRLMENACAFAPVEGDIRLSVRQCGEAEDRRGYEFCIQNKGVTVPEDVLDRIFEENAWEQSAKREELPGVGLGMTVAKAVVDAMGGTIRISSTEDGDTRVVIRFAFQPVPEAEEPSPTAEAAGEALRVLLADDNELNREIGELMLTGEGWTVELAADGAEAVEKVSSAPAGAFDLILMDVNMPVMNGYEASAAIRALPDREKAALPIIALTAETSEEASEEAEKAGMNGFAAKPIDPAAILRELRRIRDGE